jgi:hypothetical protein
MKYGMALLAVLLVVIGATFFYIPNSVPSAAAGEPNLMHWLQTLMPKQIALGLMGLGVVLGLMAWMMPTKHENVPNAPYEAFRARLGGGKRRTSK